MSNLFTQATQCRGCGEGALTEVWDLGNQYLADCLEPGETGRQAPLVVVRCQACGLAQLRHSVRREELYAKYNYRSGINETMRAALADVAAEAQKYLDPEVAKPVVLDIGSNDGYLLSRFPRPWLKYGVDPSNILAEHLRDHSEACITKGYFPEVTNPWPRGICHVITSVAMFYDVEDPFAFCREVARLLKPDGVWINQMNTLPACMARNAFDFISHEHLTYWTVTGLCKLASGAGLECIDAQVFDLNGGTARLVFKKKAPTLTPSPRLVELLVKELQAGVTGPDSWAHFKMRVDENGERLRELIKSFGQVFVRGASTRGNGLLQYYGLSHRDLPFAADRDRKKWGKVLAGTGIPIISEEQAKAREPDAFLVLPYSYLNSFLARDKEWLLEGGKYIVPLPEAKVMP